MLATVATAVGFGSIPIARLQMIADFRVCVAVGVMRMFILMALLVPAARMWRTAGAVLGMPPSESSRLERS